MDACSIKNKSAAEKSISRPEEERSFEGAIDIATDANCDGSCWDHGATGSREGATVVTSDATCNGDLAPPVIELGDATVGGVCGRGVACGG